MAFRWVQPLARIRRNRQRPPSMQTALSNARRAPRPDFTLLRKRASDRVLTFLGTNPIGELIASGLSVRRYEPHASALPQTPLTCRLSSVPPIWQIFSLSATTSARAGLPLLEPVDIAGTGISTR